MRQSTRSGGTCAYRGDDNLKCAAGCLMSDDEYQRDWDDHPTGWPVLIGRGAVNANNAMFISVLQELHDGSKPEEWRGRLISLASSRALCSDFLKDIP